MATTTQENKSKKKENIWLNLGLNIVLPSLILIKGEKWLIASGAISGDTIAPIWFFAIALAFPIIYGVYDLISRKKWNIFSILGVLNVVLTGAVGLFELSREWIIAKEAGVPALLGLIVLATIFTKKPLAKIMIFNDTLLDTQKVSAILEEKGESVKFAKTLKVSTIMIAASFFISAIIQFFLASSIFTGSTSGREFNEQVGRMTWIAHLVVFLPCMIIMIAAMFKIFSDLKKLTGLTFEQSLSPELREKS